MTTEDLAQEHTVTYQPVVIGLPISDRRTSYDFYRQALGLAPLGELDETGIPEPLQFAANSGTRIMLIPAAVSSGPSAAARPPHPATANASLPSPRPPKPIPAPWYSVPSPSAPAWSSRPASSRGDTWARSPTPTGTCGWCGPAINTPRDACRSAGAATQNAATIAGGTVMAGTAKPVLAVAAGTPGAAAELQAALARRFGAHYQVVASARAAAALEALGWGTGPVALVLAGPNRGHLRRLRRAAHAAAGAPGRRGPGRHHLADPQLSRLPARDQRPGAGLAAVEQAIMFGAGLMDQPATGLTARAAVGQVACRAVVFATGGQLPAPACPRARRTDGRGVVLRAAVANAFIIHTSPRLPPGVPGHHVLVACGRWPQPRALAARATRCPPPARTMLPRPGERQGCHAPPVAEP
jgi:hypothetical protein